MPDDLEEPSEIGGKSDEEVLEQVGEEKEEKPSEEEKPEELSDMYNGQSRHLGHSLYCPF